MAIEITRLRLKINNKPIVLSLPQNISPKIGPEIRAAFEEKNVNLRGGQSTYSRRSALIREKGLRILYSGKIINGVTKGIINGCNALLPRHRLELNPLISLMPVKDQYSGQYINILCDDPAGSTYDPKHICLPPEKPALYFVYANSRLLPSSLYRSWAYIIFDPQKSARGNIEEILGNQHILYSAKRFTLAKTV